MSNLGLRFLRVSVLAFLGLSLVALSCAAGGASEEFDALPADRFEPFSDAVATSSISDGNYVLQVLSGTAWGRLHLEGVSQFRATTRVQLSLGCAAGVVFDVQETGGFYAFLVTSDGRCGLWEFDGRAYRTISGWVKESAIRPVGEWNTVSVTVSDGVARCSVNGRESLALPHAAGAGGDIGLAAEAWGGGRASFDYLRVCDLGEAHPFRVTIVRMQLLDSAGLGRDYSHHVSVDGGAEVPVEGTGSVLSSGDVTGVRVIPVKIRIAQEVEEDGAQTGAGVGSVQLVLYSCEPGSQDQIVRIRVCGDKETGPDCANAWADWEYTLRVTVD